ncbi:MAG TPA: T9SS type A sorting domain-containing protein [Candidatus Cloacimonadota bacterium]|nr:T9SS type A sorting domain-containing protein [Candidatus Cloacimonadota bacterium]HQL15020.1 T9SS type A sorting domain-containing protein [Candidatus Cloacimonadota bacterium]
MPSLSERIYHLYFLAALLFCFCWFNLQAEYIYVVNSESRTLSRIDPSTDVVQNNFAVLGLIPNKIIVAEDCLWSVNSGDNSLQKLDKQTGSTLANILIASGCNPWDACKEGNFLYVTGLFTDKVYKVNAITQAVEASLNVGISPEALCTFGGKLFVTNTGGYQNNYANSSVSVIDLSAFTVTNTIPVAPNPQYITLSEGLLHVSCTGNWASGNGAVCVIDPASEQVIGTVEPGANLGNVWIGPSQNALVGDANGVELYRYDAHNFSLLNGGANPLPYGGSLVTGTADWTATLYPDWGSNGKVRILHPDLSFWKEYTIGLAPTDIKTEHGNTYNSEDTYPLIQKSEVYPNPARSNDLLTFTFAEKSRSTLKIYNLRGRLLLSIPISEGKAVLPAVQIATKYGAGCYLYLIEKGRARQTGKFILLP